MKYKNISQRARRYAAGKLQHAVPISVNECRAQSFADGYRLAMKEIRQVLQSESYPTFHSKMTELQTLSTDTERLK